MPRRPDSIHDPIPEEVAAIVPSTAPEPVSDPTLGIEVTLPPLDSAPPHTLVSIGDSLSQGFQHGAVFRTDLSWPALTARALGVPGYRYPTFEPLNGPGGLPLDIERLARKLEGRFGADISWHEAFRAALYVRRLMDEIEDHWETGPGSTLPDPGEPINHNLAVYGWDLRDALSADTATIAARLEEPKDQLLSQLVQNDNDIAALRTLQPSGGAGPQTMVEAAKRLGTEGVEILTVMLGANNALSTLTRLQVRWSDDGYDSLAGKGDFTVWRPSHFEAELRLLADEIRDVGARHTIWATVPHVTIAPLARGVGDKVRVGSRYYPHYTRVWITDDQFDPDLDPNLTGEHARAIDAAIDAYNRSIADVVRAARGDGLDWYVFDLCGLLDRMAKRRYLLDPASRPDWWEPYPLPDAVKALPVEPDTRFFRSGPWGRTEGGMFGLDGVHPTTLGYGLIADEVLQLVNRARGTDGGPRIDFDQLLLQDTLLSRPPTNLDPGLGLIGWLDELLDLASGPLRLGRSLVRRVT